MGAVRVLPGYRVLKDNGDVCTDATATFYLAGTTTLQEVFSDRNLSVSLGSTVSASSTGVFTTDIFVSDAISVKVIIAGTGYTSDTIDYLTVATSGALSFSGTIYPSVSDGGALGTTSYMWSDLFLASGGVINWNAGDVTVTHAANVLTFAGASSGYKFDAAVLPSASDGAALGSTALMFSDLFLASGAVVNFNNGDVTVTHSANTLAFAGASSGYSFDANILLSSGVAISWNSGDVLVTHSANALAFTGASSGYSFDAAVLPSANDAAALGASGTAWADLFLASGAVLNFAAANVTLTHASGVLTLAGGDLVLPAIAPTSVYSAGYRGAPVVSGNSAYAFPLADAGSTVYHNEAGTRTWTIPANGSVAHPIGTMFVLDNTGNSGAAGTITLAITTDTLRRGDGTAGTGSRTIAASQVAVIRKVAATEWVITGTFT